jgi:hypothetical protein
MNYLHRLLLMMPILLLVSNTQAEQQPSFPEPPIEKPVKIAKPALQPKTSLSQTSSSKT